MCVRACVRTHTCLLACLNCANSTGCVSEELHQISSVIVCIVQTHLKMIGLMLSKYAVDFMSLTYCSGWLSC